MFSNSQIQPHTYNVRVYIEDTDANQVVYHPNYLKYAERARSNILHQLGVKKSDLLADLNLRIVVAKAEIEFLSPAFLEDELMVTTQIVEISNAVIIMQQNISRFSTILARVLVKLAVINDQLKPVRWPKHLVDKLSNLNFRTE
jgi:tol-pal system-associated acyl-CoA thioesterase